MRTRIQKPIFMIGMPRSGTTILSEAISLHEDLGWFSNYLNLFAQFPWIAILDRIADSSTIGRYLRGKKNQGKGIASFVRRLLPHTDEAYFIWRRCCGEKFLLDYLIGQTATDEEARSIAKYVQMTLRCQRKKRFFTKLTGPPRIHYLNSIFSDAYFIHVIRDPRAVVSSLLEVPFWKEGDGLVRPWWRNGLRNGDIEKWEESDRSPVALGAVQWKRVVEMAWEEKNFISPRKYLEIRYEGFVGNPHGILREVFERLGLKDSLFSHRYLSLIGRPHNMNYKYRQYLHADEISLIERITYQTARRAGYKFAE